MDDAKVKNIKQGFYKRKKHTQLHISRHILSIIILLYVIHYDHPSTMLPRIMLT